MEVILDNVKLSSNTSTHTQSYQKPTAETIHQIKV